MQNIVDLDLEIDHVMTLRYDRCAPIRTVPQVWVRHSGACGLVSRGTYNQEASLSLS